MFSHCFSPDSGFFQCAATEVCDEISRERKFYTIKLLVICNTSMSTNKQTKASCWSYTGMKLFHLQYGSWDWGAKPGMCLSTINAVFYIPMICLTYLIGEKNYLPTTLAT